jgi:hypothetical protein
MALTESMFGLAADVEDDRLCRDIPDSQCREEPRNLVRVTLAHIGSKAGDALADPKVVMPWLMGALGAPAFLTAMIVPIRESLALLPQVIVGGVIRRFAKRKYFWVYAALIQGLAVIAMAGVAYGGMEGHAAGWAIIALVTLFSLARGVASIAWKDTLGKTVDKGRRGRVGGYAASAAGVIASGVGLYLALSPEAARPDWLLLALLAAAGASWIAGALIFLTVNEHDGATDGGRGIKDIARDQIRLILGDAELQRFIFARALMTATALSGPLYVALAQRSGGQALDKSWMATAGIWPRWRAQRLILGHAGGPVEPGDHGDWRADQRIAWVCSPGLGDIGTGLRNRRITVRSSIVRAEHWPFRRSYWPENTDRRYRWWRCKG